MTTKKPLFIIDEQQPGSILKDFATLLAFVEEGKYPVSKKLLHFPPKAIIELNQRMTHPIQHKFSRPAQKTFYPINTLYICAKYLGFFYYESKASNKVITLNKKALNEWNKLNDTEKYFTLFDICMTNHDITWFPIIQSLDGYEGMYLWKGKISMGHPLYKRIATGYDSLPVLAVLELLGICQIEQLSESSNKGWSIKSIEKTKIGDTIFSHLEECREYINKTFRVAEDLDDAFLGMGCSVFRPYFPELKKSYQRAVEDTQGKGDYVFKVSLESKVWRRITLNHNSTLDMLADSILYYFDFENDHLHSFDFIDIKGKKVEYVHEMADGLPTNDITLKELPLGIKSSMHFVFDFGDYWEFDVLLEKINSPSVIDDGYCEFLIQQGEAPQQYPDWDED